MALNPVSTAPAMAANSESPIYDALFPDGDRAPVGTYNFVTPGRIGAGTQDPKFDLNNITLDGYFRIRNNIGNPGDNGQIYDNSVVGVTPNGLILIGQKGQSVNFLEVAIPSTLSATLGTSANNYSGLPEATALQDFYTVDETLLSTQFDPTGNRKPGYVYVHNNKIYLCYLISYGYSVTNILIGDNASDFTNCNWQGWMTADGTDRAAMYMSAIPAEHQEKFGGDTHFNGTNFTMSIIARSSYGPSFYTLSPDSIESTDTHIPRTNYMRFTQTNNGPHVEVEAETARDHYSDCVGMPLSSYVVIPNQHRPNSLSFCPPYDNNLCPDGGGDVNQSGVGFIMPGTDTFVNIGTMGGVRNGVLYKRPYIENGNGAPSAGFSPVSDEDRDSMVWAFNLNDIAATTPNDTTTTASVPIQSISHLPGDVRPERGAYDEVNQKLYTVMSDEDDYSRQKLVAVYSVATAV